jgi:hypothetical protein
MAKTTAGPQKPSAASLDSVRWRAMFTDFATGLLIAFAGGQNHDNEILDRAEKLADEGMKRFYSRYAKEILS